MPDMANLSLPAGVYLVPCWAGPVVPNRLPFFAGERPVLIDSGLMGEPDSVIVPSLRSYGFDPADLAILINSHADVDHTGGNAGLLAHCPQARLACGGPDKGMVESDQALWDIRWNQLKADHGIAYADEYRGSLGAGTRVDWVLRDGDEIALGGDHSLQVIATPGHSLGHLAFLLLPERILFCGDGVQAEPLPPGQQTKTPQYLDAGLYLQTLARIGRARPKLLLTCHLGAFAGPEIKALLNVNRRFILEVDQALGAVLAEAGPSLTLMEITSRVSRRVGQWPEASDIDFAFSVNGHVQAAVRQGWAKTAGPERPLRYVGGGA